MTIVSTTKKQPTARSQRYKAFLQLQDTIISTTNMLAKVLPCNNLMTQMLCYSLNLTFKMHKLSAYKMNSRRPSSSLTFISSMRRKLIWSLPLSASVSSHQLMTSHFQLTRYISNCYSHAMTSKIVTVHSRNYSFRRHSSNFLLSRFSLRPRRFSRSM